MNKEEYFSKINSGLQDVLGDALFNGSVSQMFAWNLGARFDKNYDEDFIWRRALYLSSNACKLLKKDFSDSTAIKSLKLSAEIYEYLSGVSEIYDKNFCFILSALCYDISGYQANALCMMRELMLRGDFYSVVLGEELNTNLNDENYILFHIQLILLKKIPQAFNSPKRSNKSLEECEDWLGIKLFDTSIFGLYDHIINGRESSFIEDVYECYRYYLTKGNIFISHLLQLLTCRFYKYSERSVWNILSPFLSGQDNTWDRYARLLTNDFYGKTKVKPLNERCSIFEFWISQLKAIEQGVLGNNESFVIQMPTSAGKTFIAELAILDNLVKYPEKKCIYIAPFRALTNEKEIEISQNLSKIGYSISSLSGDYEIDEFHNFILNSTDVLIATPEKLDLLYRLQRDYFTNISLLVIDEGHIIGDINERAALLEFLIIRLKIKVPTIKILFISAVMPPSNGIEFSKWLSNKENNIVMSPKYANEDVWEPTRRLIGKFSLYSNYKAGQITYPFNKYLDKNQEFKEPFVPNFIKIKEYGNAFPNTSKGQITVAIAYKLSLSGSTLIFTSKPNWAESLGVAFLSLIDKLKKNEEVFFSSFVENTSSNSFFVCSNWLGTEHSITKCVKHGIGIHFGDLPETVRKAVEYDYRTGVLKVLIATNTIGQGVNFPIKNLIIHSLDIDTRVDKNIKVSVRDFWNIIGRAGRAGKETEGQIIFISLTSSDENNFKRYTNKHNINIAESIFSLILKLRIKRSITELQMDEYINFYSESFLMSLMVEELLETDDEAIVEQVIKNSLFQVQAYDIVLLRDGFLRSVKKIRETVKDVSRLKSFASNGFSLKSNIVIESYIEENLEKITICLETDDYLNLIELILNLFSFSEIKEVKFSEKLIGLDSKALDLFGFIKDWILGKDIDYLFQVWQQSVPETLKSQNKMFVFFSQGLNYKYPWGVTSFLAVLSYKIGIPIQELPTNIKSISSYIKYGLNDNLACFILSLGVRSRDLSKFIISKYSGVNSYEELLRWISNLTYEQIKSWGLTNNEIDNIVELSIKYNTRRDKSLPKAFVFDVKGIYYSESAKAKSLDVKVGDILNYEKDINNIYDPFAIKLFHEGIFVGNIPRNRARALSLEVDLLNLHFTVEVIKVKPVIDYNKITVLLRKIV